MRHAGKETLDQLEPLLEHVRRVPRMIERTPGCFYLGSKAYLHFHEDPLGIFADVKLNGEKFERLRVSTKAERTRFLTLFNRNLKLRE
jgi:hypothetical protein